MTTVAHKMEEAERGARADARERRDIVSGEIMPDNRLFRFVADPDGQVVPDVAAKLPGRGLWVEASRDAVNKAVEKAPKVSMMYVARGVGNYYVPAQLGGGAKLSIPDFQKAIELDPRNAEAYLWLGLSLRKENRDAEARQAFAKSLELNPNRVWAKQQLEKTPAK